MVGPMAIPESLIADQKFFNEHVQEWIPEHEREYAVVNSGSVVGFFGSYDEAYTEALRRFGLRFRGPGRRTKT